MEPYSYSIIRWSLSLSYIPSTGSRPRMYVHKYQLCIFFRTKLVQKFLLIKNYFKFFLTNYSAVHLKFIFWILENLLKNFFKNLPLKLMGVDGFKFLICLCLKILIKNRSSNLHLILQRELARLVWPPQQY